MYRTVSNALTYSTVPRPQEPRVSFWQSMTFLQQLAYSWAQRHNRCIQQSGDYSNYCSLQITGAAPAYLADNCHLLSDAGRRPLRSHSNDIRKLLVPRTHNKLGDRSFSAAGPRLWNDLQPGLRQPGLSFDSFRRSLKTHLFGNWSAYWLFRLIGAI